MPGVTSDRGGGRMDGVAPQILYDMKYFLLLLLTMMIGFSCAFYVMFRYVAPNASDDVVAFDLLRNE